MSQNIRILVIEDEKNIQNFITSVLNSQHYQVISSLTGRDGLSQAASASPDLILLDLGLPDMDGMEIIRKIREWSDTPILVISARVQEDECWRWIPVPMIILPNPSAIQNCWPGSVLHSAI